MTTTIRTVLQLLAIVGVTIALPFACAAASYHICHRRVERQLKKWKARWHDANYKYAGDSKCEKPLHQARASIRAAWLCNMDGEPWMARKHLSRAETKMRKAERASTREQREALASRRAVDFDAWFAGHGQDMRQSRADALAPQQASPTR